MIYHLVEIKGEILTNIIFEDIITGILKNIRQYIDSCKPFYINIYG